jgi:hypothetical protein
MLRKAIGPQRVGSHDTLIELDVAKFMTSLSNFQGAPVDMIQQCVMFPLIDHTGDSTHSHEWIDLLVTWFPKRHMAIKSGRKWERIYPIGTWRLWTPLLRLLTPFGWSTYSHSVSVEVRMIQLGLIFF